MEACATLMHLPYFTFTALLIMGELTVYGIAVVVKVKSKTNSSPLTQLAMYTISCPSHYILLTDALHSYAFLACLRAITVGLEVCGPDDPRSKSSRLPFIIQSGQDG